MYGKSTTPYDRWNAYVQHVRCTRRSLQFNWLYLLVPDLDKCQLTASHSCSVRYCLLSLGKSVLERILSTPSSRTLSSRLLSLHGTTSASVSIIVHACNCSWLPCQFCYQGQASLQLRVEDSVCLHRCIVAVFFFFFVCWVNFSLNMISSILLCS